jgi:hypothetical protein
MADGLVTQRTQGTPQGGPLSPLLSNILRTALDRELRRPVSLQMVFEFSHRELIYTRRALVLNHPLIREHEVVAFHYGFHQARCRYLRFRSACGSPCPPRREPPPPPNAVRCLLRPPDLPDQLLPSSASLRSRRLLAALHVRPFGSY